MKRADVEGHTATRDLAHLAELGLLAPHGTGRGRLYTAAGPVLEAAADVRSRRTPITDPYPWMRPKLAEQVDLGMSG